ncbi:MAG: hypothetical protein RIR97_1000, partial [Pseudomonadota bacterium]
MIFAPVRKIRCAAELRANPDEMETVLLVAAATNARRAARDVAVRIRPSRPT